MYRKKTFRPYSNSLSIQHLTHIFLLCFLFFINRKTTICHNSFKPFFLFRHYYIHCIHGCKVHFFTILIFFSATFSKVLCIDLQQRSVSTTYYIHVILQYAVLPAPYSQKHNLSTVEENSQPYTYQALSS